MDCRVHRCDGTQQLWKEGQYLELHKRIFILDMGWTNMRALKGDSPEILKRPFFWKFEDLLPRSMCVDLVDVGKQQSYLVLRRMTRGRQ